jgi:cell division protein FtsL
MSENDTKQKIEIDEVMLAMDVVDTLRHQQSLVERELASDEREQALTDKVKRMYASQGLEVTDEIIAEGVAALREDRFAYQPPPPRGSMWLAKLYVNRKRWAKVAAVAAASVVAVFLIYRLVYVGPQARKRMRATQEINTQIGQQQDQISVAKQRLKNLNQALSSAKSKAPQHSEVAVKRLLAEAGQQLSGAQTKLQAFDKLSLTPNLDGDTLAKQGDVIKGRLEQRSSLVREVNTNLDKAEAALTGLSQLAVLPQKLASQRNNLLTEIKEDAARRQAEKLYADALAALNRGDVDGALKGSAALQQLQEQVMREYEVRIVSRPGTPSGVWRQPKNRPGVRNYYLIVEAVTPKGERLTFPIASEEDGTTKNVQQWGLRVNSTIFDKIRRDKMDDGIIQNNRLGVKERGYLNPQYLMPTTNAAITQW